MKIGASNYDLIKDYGEEESIKLLAKAGFDSIDYNLESCDNINGNKLFINATDDEFVAYFKNVKNMLDRNNIAVGQTHAYTGGIKFTTSQEYFNITLRCIKATEILGSKLIVIHPLILPSYKYDDNKEECKEMNMEFFTKLIPYLQDHDIKNGLENMWNWDDNKKKICSTVCSRPEEIIDYIETLNSDRFVACLDLGHVNLTSDTGDTVEGAILKLGKYLEMVHIHDNDGIDDLHIAPFFGNTNWINVAKAFKSVGYKGILNLEVGNEYFNRFGKNLAQGSTNYLAESARLLSSLIESV